MDTSKEYIKMSDCPEIQGQMFDFEDGHTNDNSAYSGKVMDGGHLVWLPRQDQIQEMIPKCSCLMWEERVHCLTQRFWQFVRKYQEDINCLTMEQLWLAFYMFEKHSKIWDGDKWTKTDL